MNAADTIRAAITRLEQQRAAATAGVWQTRPETPGKPDWGFELFATTGNPREWVDLLEGGYYAESPGTIKEADAALIVTLHRTIDAQIVILRDNLGGAQDLDGGHAPDYPGAVQDALALARAILDPEQETHD